MIQRQWHFIIMIAIQVRCTQVRPIAWWDFVCCSYKNLFGNSFPPKYFKPLPVIPSYRNILMTILDLMSITGAILILVLAFVSACASGEERSRNWFPWLWGLGSQICRADQQAGLSQAGANCNPGMEFLLTQGHLRSVLPHPGFIKSWLTHTTIQVWGS